MPSLRSFYSFPTLVDFGAGTLENLPRWVKSYGTRPMIVTDPGVAQLPLFGDVRKVLSDAGIKFGVFSGISPNPTDTEVNQGGAMMRQQGCDVVIGLGGGSALDGAKGVALMASHDGSILDYDDADGGMDKIRSDVPPVICISTTAGTGSEVGRSLVVVDTVRNVKVVVFSPYLMPKLAIIDPQLHLGLPPHLTAATGMDALTHCIEALLSTGFHPMADGIALSGIRLIGESLERAVKHGDDIDARSRMAIAAAMGATAFQKGLGVIHSLAHPCSTVAHVHHGLANGVLIETGLRYNREVSEDALALIARNLNLPGANSAEQADATIAWVCDLRDRINIPSRLSDVGVTEAMLPEMIEQAVLDGCKAYNPRPVSREDIVALYSEAL
jgi:4-hydroxybutyrate dehydrogenase